MRAANRQKEELRPVIFERCVNKYAQGSCIVKFGDTHVLCTASVEERLPTFLRNSNKGGWLTAEYNMLPCSTHTRIRRDISLGKQNGRSLEIQRLIGRSLRSVMDLKALGERQIIIDCDVLQADGGTRTAAITGSWMALYDCLTHLQKKQLLSRDRVLKNQIAAISCGICQDDILLDLDYKEDNNADVDANFIFSGDGNIVEIQTTGENRTITEDEFLKLMNLARKGVEKLLKLQKLAIEQAL